MTIAASVPATTTPKRMTLSAVKRGRLEKPLRVLLFGQEGVGKSTFGANAPEPIFLCAEDGTSQLDVARFPQIATWADALEAVNTLIDDAHDFKTLVIDTLDALEGLCWAQVIRENNWTTIEDPGYGKGYTAALSKWRGLIATLELLRAKRAMGIVLLAHSQVKTFNNPEGPSFDRYVMKLNDKASALWREWCDVVGFASFETYAAKKEGKTLGVSSGARILHTQRTAAFDAKNRHNLPPRMPLSWTDFTAAVAAGQPADAQTLQARISELLKGADAELTGRVAKAVSAAVSNPAELARIADHLAAVLSTKEAGQ